LKNKKNGNENKESCENLCNLVVRKRKMLKDERGQLSIDFLVGISLFILALLFMAHFIPGMFVPFQSETIDLNSVAYRTSVILVEDPGWWNGTGADCGEDWENHITDTSRVGLAIDKEHPNMLLMNKITGFENCIGLTNKLGLYRKIGDNEIDYGYNITLQFPGDEWGGTRMRGESAPSSGDVVKMKRTVSVRVSEFGGIDASDMSGASDPVKPLLVIDGADVHTFCTKDLYISITNFTLEGTKPGFTYVKITQTNLSKFPSSECDLHDTGNGLHINMGSLTALKLDDPLDGYRQVKNYTDNITVPIGGLGDNADINFANDTLLIRINKSAWDRAGINTSTGADDVVIEINLNKIKCEEVHHPDKLLRYSETEAFSIIPIRLIIQVWT